KGELVTTEGASLGQHRGIAFYTVGQRRGLGVSAGERRYVVRLDAARNKVVIGKEDDLYRGSFSAEQLNWVALSGISGSLHAEVKIRYRSLSVPARLFHDGDHRVRVELERPQRAITPGQSVVFYRGETVLGGGIISATREGDEKP